MRNTRILVLIAALSILIGILIFSVFSLSQITGEAIKNHYTYTKAICDNENYCEDYIITCEDNEISSVVTTGAVVQFSKDWEDPRSEEMIKRTC
jgi:hypothetical protein|tara:strand:+ start:11355 stop:11636 length:282 start_codon:yes stop_codon:yes gene_type:complete